MVRLQMADAHRVLHRSLRGKCERFARKIWVENRAIVAFMWGAETVDAGCLFGM